MVFTRCSSSELQFGAFREVVARKVLKGAEARRSVPWHALALSSEYTTDSATVEGSSIVDHPGEC